MRTRFEVPVIATPMDNGLFRIQTHDGDVIAEQIPPRYVDNLIAMINYHALLIDTLEALFNTHWRAPNNELQKAINDTCFLLLEVKKL